MKKIITSSLLVLTLISFQGCNDDPTESEENIETCLNKDIQMTNTSISSYTIMSTNILQQSNDLLKLAQTLESTGSTANTEYLNAMLQLSTDIGTMADRILIMADNIGIMSDRIVEVININSQNLALTQSNLLEATRIFTSLL